MACSVHYPLPMNVEQQNLYTDTSGAPASETDIETPATYKVLLDKRQSVEAALLQLQKRAVKRGLSPLLWSWGKAYITSHEERDGSKTKIARIPLTFEGSASCRFEGWTFVAALEHLDGENIVRALPGKTLPPEYRTRGPQCDHCKLARRRADTYVVRHEDGRLVQVGSTCIADFLGSSDATKIAAYATMLASARGLAEGGESEGFGGGGSGDVALSQYLPIVAWCVRVQGWTSRTVARERGSSATADIALHFMSCREKSTCKICREANCKPTDVDIALAEASEVWAESLSDGEVNAQAGSDYLHNLRAVARTGVVGFRSAGIAASMVTAYERAQGVARKRAERAARPASVHVGTVGKRETFSNLALDFVTGYDTQYGYTTVLKFITDAGAVLTWKASNTDIVRGDVGKRYDVKGTVKKHDEYKGQKQTLLSRCTVTEVKPESKEEPS